REEQAEILKEMERCTISISNHKILIRKAIEFSRNLPLIWAKGNIGIKEKLQKLIFPEGIAYDKQNGVFRTDKINFIIAAIARLSGDSALIEKGLFTFLCEQSLSAEREGFVITSTSSVFTAFYSLSN
ncbi:MAG: hypothetical protein ACT4ON_01080, partial [Bacteroidota bacterium]